MFGDGSKIHADEIITGNKNNAKVLSRALSDINVIPRNTTSGKLPNDYPIGWSMEWGTVSLYGLSDGNYVTTLTIRPYTDNSVPVWQIGFIHGKYIVVRRAAGNAYNNYWLNWERVNTTAL